MIESHTVTVNPFFLPKEEQFNLSALSHIHQSKITRLKFRIHTNHKKPELPELPRLPKLNSDLDNIAKVICEYFKITIEELSGPSQKGTIMKARKIFCAIARIKTRLSLQKIGEFVNRDHCTVRWAHRSIEELRMKVNIESGMNEHYEKIIQRFE